MKTSNFPKLLCLMSLSAFAYLPSAQAATIYVNAAATGVHDGTSWATAFNNLQDALDVAAQTGPDDIWVAKGTYHPTVTDPNDTNNVNPTNVNGDKFTFVIPDQTKIYGGFAGGESLLSQRDPDNNKTILSGDLLDNDLTDRSQIGAYKQSKVDNVYHVVTMLNVTATLDGLVIQGGYANGKDTRSQARGGGIFINSGVPTMNKVVVQYNDALKDDVKDSPARGGGIGGGIFITQFSGSPSVVTMTDSVIAHNNTDLKGGGFQSLNATVTMSGMHVFDNHATECGNIVIQDGSIHLSNSLIEQNRSLNSCSALWLIATGNPSYAPSLVETSIFKNNVGGDCGVVKLQNDSGALVLPVTFVNNTFDNNMSTNYTSQLLSCGVICNYGMNAIIDHNTFSNNLGITCGAICLSWDTSDKSFQVVATTEIKNNTFVGNKVDRNNGGAGAVGVKDGQIALIHNNTFDSNSTATNGGAIVVDRATATINANNFTGNDAQGLGDAIYGINAILNNVIVDNTFAPMTANTVVLVTKNN